MNFLEAARIVFLQGLTVLVISGFWACKAAPGLRPSREAAEAQMTGKLTKRPAEGQPPFIRYEFSQVQAENPEFIKSLYSILSKALSEGELDACFEQILKVTSKGRFQIQYKWKSSSQGIIDQWSLTDTDPDSLTEVECLFSWTRKLTWPVGSSSMEGGLIIKSQPSDQGDGSSQGQVYELKTSPPGKKKIRTFQ